MSTIVKHYDKKTGKIRVYESTPHYDPISKQSRPKRKYLGTLDPETGELIPSSGRRGRTSVKNASPTKDCTTPDIVMDLQRLLSEKEAEIASLQSEIRTLKTSIKSYENICASISNELRKAPCNL